MRDSRVTACKMFVFRSLLQHRLKVHGSVFLREQFSYSRNGWILRLLDNVIRYCYCLQILDKIKIKLLRFNI